MVQRRVTADRNFDDLAGRLHRNVYGGLKGRIRLAVLERDLSHHLLVPPFAPQVEPPTRLRILDAGGGKGLLSLRLARAGHRVTLCDISSEMLKQAREEAQPLGVEDQVRFLQCPIQNLPQFLSDDDPGFDLVLCHAVLEWVLDPHSVLNTLVERLKPKGYLSLVFYNRHGLVYKNLLRGRFQGAADAKSYQQGKEGSLTPTHPLDPEQVYQWLDEFPLSVRCLSGIRVFYDYLSEPLASSASADQILASELALSRKDPYRSLGRYLHWFGQRRS